MEDNQQSQDHAPLRASSEEALISPRPPTGGSNRRAFKVAGLTVLACLLLASQALTAYLVINQRGQINTLQKNSDKMSKRLTSRAQVAPVRMHIPMNTMPLLKDFTDEDLEKTETPMTKLQDTAMVSLEMQVTNILQELNSSLPQFNQTFLANLQSLKTKMMADEWMGLQTWMRHWLIFQMAQQKPSVPVQTLQSKCSLEAAPGRVHPGFYQPQCDEQGHYKPLQCWHSTGYCWCVDSEGNPIPGTRMRGKPTCDGAPAPIPGQGVRHMAAMPKTFQLKSLPTDE